MQANLYNQKGEISGKVDLPESIFGLKWNSDLVHQVVTSMTSNARGGNAHAKTRGEVSGTGKKPWRQKGTGRARHGSTRSPIWVGGGTTHGPRNDKNYDRKINTKVRAKALFTVLSKKLKDGEVIFVDNVSFKDTKTKLANDFITKLSENKEYSYLARKNRKNGLIAFSGDNSAELKKSFKNLPAVDVCLTKNLNPVDVLNRKYLILENAKSGIQFLESRIK